MKKTFKLLDIDFNMFDAGASGNGTGGSQSGGTTGGPDSTQQGENAGGADANHNGQEAAAAAEADGAQKKPSDAGKGKKAQVQTTSDALEAKRKAYYDLVNGEYKDIYTEDTQRLMSSRFKNVKSLEEQLGAQTPVIDMLMQRYGIKDGDISKLSQALDNDNALWEAAADEAGMDVEQFKRYQAVMRENEALMKEQRRRQGEEAMRRQMQKWAMEAEAVKGEYPEFDLAAESQNPEFISLLKAGVPLGHAYEVLHMEDITSRRAQAAAQAAERQVSENIKARGARPVENGVASQSAFTVKDDPGKWSKKDREEIARRVSRGEVIKL